MEVMKTSRRASTLAATVIAGEQLSTSLMLTGSALKKKAKFLQKLVTTLYHTLSTPKKQGQI